MASQTKVREMIAKNNAKKGGLSDKIVPIILAIISAISILTTIAILFTLLTETITFFTRVPLSKFFLSGTWNPTGSSPEFGIWALIIGTLKITVIATIVAVPIGLGAAIYLNEYASDRSRRIIKPILEILAGIPTIVFGFFVPDKIREGAFGLGATKFEVATKVVLPAATSGVVASIVLGISRAIGETMIVSLAAGSSPTSSLSLTSSIQTMTGYIVEIATGDAAFGSDIYYSIYAVGFTLFIFTLIMNLLSQWISKRFREEY